MPDFAHLLKSCAKNGYKICLHILRMCTGMPFILTLLVDYQ